ncbi:hypothetical protein [Sediminibacter sp. Hel_I_10]|uniref:hypothetical protein n=1 Tax=Sediminibacter sp. Hel_I_10 TaxID=1392490 RepID=UPI00047A8C11|nr:hypothetical protein [Sediminibacter sp. Hel_I_10]
MTEADIDNALKPLLKSKEFKSKHDLDKHAVYYLRNKANTTQKLQLLFEAGKLKIIEDGPD